MSNSSDLNRFTGRAENYAQFRPRYPDAVIDLLGAEAGWSEHSSVADIGAGTGISSEPFLSRGNRVWAVEPNGDMRAVLETLRTRYPLLEVVNGTAESTALAASNVDFVVAGTAFHWFHPRACQPEFLRILKPQGLAVLMWNVRQTKTSEFLQGYEEILVRFGTDYKERWGKQRSNITKDIAPFFGSAGFRSASFDNPQYLHVDGLMGRLLSTSYSPLPGQANYEPMMAATRELFTQFARNGLVNIDYQTTVYWGRPACSD